MHHEIPADAAYFLAESPRSRKFAVASDLLEVRREWVPGDPQLKEYQRNGELFNCCIINKTSIWSSLCKGVRPVRLSIQGSLKSSKRCYGEKHGQQISNSSCIGSGRLSSFKATQENPRFRHEFIDDSVDRSERACQHRLQPVHPVRELPSVHGQRA